MDGVDLDDIKSQFKLEGRLCIILIFFTHFIKQARFYWQFRRKCSTSFIVNLKGHVHVCREILGGGWLEFLYF